MLMTQEMKTFLKSVKHKHKPFFLFQINARRFTAYFENPDEEKNSFNSFSVHDRTGDHEIFHNTIKDCHQVKKAKGQKENKRKTSDKIISCSRAGNIDSVENETPRKNDLNIQMLSKNLYNQIFGENTRNSPDPNIIKKAQEELKSRGLWKDEIDFLEDVSLKLPLLKGKNIEEHFLNIGNEQCEPYKKLLSSFVETGIPDAPKKWLFQKGWTKYEKDKPPEAVSFPAEEALVLDVEVCVKLGDLPTLAIAVSENAWYGWVSSHLAEGISALPGNNYSTDALIPVEGKGLSKETPRIIIGHNVSYDRARIKEQYYLKNSALRFLDTMSLHTCIGGLTRTQKNVLKKKNEENELESWKILSCLSSLKEIYFLYCKKELIKDKRDVFLKGTLTDVVNDFQNLMKYCKNDVKATYEVFQIIFPVFLQMFPHPVTLAGMLEMGSGFLPVNNNWKKFLADADQTYEDLKNEITLLLSKKCDNACQLFHDQDYKNDLWMWNEDWTTQQLKLTKKKVKPPLLKENKKLAETSQDNFDEEKEEKELAQKFQYLFDLEQILPKIKPFLPGYPLWYRKLCKKPDSENWTPYAQVSTGMIVTPKLLKLTWENFPLYHTHEFGWGILVADIFAENVTTNLPFKMLKELTLKNCNLVHNMNLDEFKAPNKSLTQGKKEFPVPYYKGSGIWCDHIIDGCCYFFKLPHKDGGGKNVGNPLSKDFTQIFSSNILSGSDAVAAKVLDMGKKLMYWRNNRERIISQMVVWLNKKEAQIFSGLDEDTSVGVIIPKVVVCGTLTRRAMEATWLTASKVTQNRIGSELRSMIQAPPGYHIVGADVDSQELWIASLIGDSYLAKEHGSTPLGWMTLSGSKSNQTDMHSMTAKAVGISRDHAKVINYARIYGAGIKFAQKLLQQFNPSMSDQEAHNKASKMYALTKGKKVYEVKESVINEFHETFGSELQIYDLGTASRLAKFWGKKLDEVFEKSQWINGTESAMFNQLEKIANSSKPVTPFLQCRLSHALEPQFQGDDFHLRTRINWVVQSGAVDFLHLMLVCMKWLTNGRARYCFSFHDEVRFIVPSEERYSAALAMHITNLLVRSFCSFRMGISDLPQSVAFFSSVEVDKTLRKEADDDCITPSNPHGIEKGYGIPPGESLNIYEAIKKSEGIISQFATGKNQKCLKPPKESMSTGKFLKKF